MLRQTITFQARVPKDQMQMYPSMGNQPRYHGASEHLLLPGIPES